MFCSRSLAGVLIAAAALAVSVPSAFADAPSTAGGVSFGHGEVKTCTTDYQAGNQGQYGAWGAYVDGCTVKVKCYFRAGCTVGGRGLIQDEEFNGRRVTLNSRLRLLDAGGRTTKKRWDQSCDGSNSCTAGHVDALLPYLDVASVQCNGVHDGQGGRAKVTCTIQVTDGYEFIGLRGSKAVQKCPDADTPVDQISDQSAEAALLCLTNYQRRVAGLPGLIYNPNLGNAAHDEAADAVATPWWENGADWHTNPFTGTTPADRIVAAGYCPEAKDRNLGRPENVYTAYSYGEGATAPTPRAAVHWWMTHHIADGISPEQNGHRMAILNPDATEMGNGVVLGTGVPNVTADKAGTFVQTFGACVS